MTDKETRILTCLREIVSYKTSEEFKTKYSVIFKRALTEEADLEYAKKLLPLMAANYTDLFPEGNTIFFDVAVAGRIDICTWLLTLSRRYKIDPFKNWRDIISVCSKRTIMWFLSQAEEYVIDPPEIYYYAFAEAIIEGNLIICWHIHHEYSIKIKFRNILSTIRINQVIYRWMMSKYTNVLTSEEHGEIFSYLLIKGDLELCIELLPFIKFPGFYRYPTGHLHICKWLMTLPKKFGIFHKHNRPLEIAIVNDHLNGFKVSSKMIELAIKYHSRKIREWLKERFPSTEPEREFDDYMLLEAINEEDVELCERILANDEFKKSFDYSGKIYDKVFNATMKKSLSFIGSSSSGKRMMLVMSRINYINCHIMTI